MLIAAVCAVALLLAWLGIAFNRLVRDHNLMREAWSGIEVQLKRRYDLIPNLVSTAGGYGSHERRLTEETTRLRTQCMQASGAQQQGLSETALSAALRGILAVVEAYPELKANENYLALQKQLSEIEDQIQLSRRYYNGSVRNYNTRVESFPSMLVAGAFKFEPAEFFEIEYATERQVPEVSL